MYQMIKKESWGLSFWKVSTTETINPQTKEKVATTSESQYGAFVSGGGVDMGGIHNLTHDQLTELHSTGSVRL